MQSNGSFAALPPVLNKSAALTLRTKNENRAATHVETTFICAQVGVTIILETLTHVLVRVLFCVSCVRESVTRRPLTRACEHSNINDRTNQHDKLCGLLFENALEKKIVRTTAQAALNKIKTHTEYENAYYLWSQAESNKCR